MTPKIIIELKATGSDKPYCAICEDRQISLSELEVTKIFNFSLRNTRPAKGFKTIHAQLTWLIKGK